MKLFSKTIGLLIKLTFIIPNKKIQESIKRKLKRWRIQINPNLFDDRTFLNYVQKKKEGFEKNINSIQTLAIRGSNADYGFYSPMWKNSYNLGLTSSDLFHSYHLYKNYRKDLTELKNVLLYASVSCIGLSLIHTSERYRAVAYKYFFNIPYAQEGFITPKHEKTILKKCSNLYPVEVDSTYTGYDRKTYYGTHITTEKRVIPHLRENRRTPNQIDWLNKLIELIQLDKRRIFIIIQPFRNDYKGLLPQQNILFQELFKLKNIDILNFFNSNLFSDQDFGDHDHLNEQGAIKLTYLIYKHLKSNNLL